MNMNEIAIAAAVLGGVGFALYKVISKNSKKKDALKKYRKENPYQGGGTPGSKHPDMGPFPVVEPRYKDIPDGVGERYDPTPVSDEEAAATVDPVPVPKVKPPVVVRVEDPITKVKISDDEAIFRNLFFAIRLLKGNQLYRMEDKPFEAWIDKTDKFTVSSLLLCNTEGDVLAVATSEEGNKIKYTTDMSSGPCYIFTTSDTDATNAVVRPIK